MTKILCITALCLLTLSAITPTFSSDFPKCVYRGYSWKNENDKVVVNITTNGKCHHSFRAGNVRMLQDLQLIKKPSHGTVEIVSVAELNYYPDPKYDEKDTYSIKTCSNEGGNSIIGCSTIIYEIEVHSNIN